MPRRWFASGLLFFLDGDEAFDMNRAATAISGLVSLDPFALRQTCIAMFGAQDRNMLSLTRRGLNL
jgi:hypothetical protein